ncbi:UPF0149 family protein, partial [Klebsiella pneumoniae]|nr:UPF0149 family protein [Klebsiella pneumoniae]
RTSPAFRSLIGTNNGIGSSGLIIDGTEAQKSFSQLSEYLDGDHNEYGLDFAATHGFLCAIAVGPQFDRWLDELFEGNQKKVPAEIIQQIKVWLESIRQYLANENGIEFPFEVEEADV